MKQLGLEKSGREGGRASDVFLMTPFLTVAPPVLAVYSDRVMAVRYRWDDFVLDLDAYRLERAGVPVALEPKAFNLLALMVQRPGHLFSKQEIFAAVWPDAIVTDHALTRVVAQIRRALGDEAREARYIETVPTRGYRWVKTVDRVPNMPDVPAVPNVLVPGAQGAPLAPPAPAPQAPQALQAP